jgi:Ohr subfamily peroxiredoxin
MLFQIGVLDLQLSMPKALGGSGEAGKTNPEQLFAAGYSACFQSAMGLVAGKMKISGDTKVTAHVSIGQDASKSLGLAVELKVESSDIPKGDLQKIVEEAHKVCPYSRATRNNIDVKLTVL